MSSLVLPHNTDAEETVLGAMLVSQKAVETVSELLNPSDFYSPAQAVIYETMLRMHAAGVGIDLVSLNEQLERDQLLDKAGGRSRVHELALTVSAASNVAHHAGIVRDHAVRRELIHAGQDIARSGFEPDGTTQEMLGRAESLIYALTTTQERGELQHVRESLPETYATLERPGGEITGTPIGLHTVDKLTAGFHPGNLVLVAARPGMGKSALAIGAAHHNAIQHDTPVALFTLEMSRQEINQRLLSQMTGVPLMQIRTRIGLTPRDHEQLRSARPVLETSSLFIDDTVSARLLDIRARARRLKTRLPHLGLIIVDYVQLMLSDGRSENRNLEVAAISRGLKLLARELETPVMALSQLSRAVEQRHDKTPMLSDLRDSGALEQDADTVIFLHRKQDEEITRLTVAKQRNGPTDQFNLAWLKERAMFSPAVEA